MPVVSARDVVGQNSRRMCRAEHPISPRFVRHTAAAASTCSLGRCSLHAAAFVASFPIHAASPAPAVQLLRTCSVREGRGGWGQDADELRNIASSATARSALADKEGAYMRLRADRLHQVSPRGTKGKALR